MIDKAKQTGAQNKSNCATVVFFRFESSTNFPMHSLLEKFPVSDKSVQLHADMFTKTQTFFRIITATIYHIR